jgi:hypothetical protein
MLLSATISQLRVLGRLLLRRWYALMWRVSMERAAEGNAAGVDEVRDELEHRRTAATARRKALETLRWNWGDAYKIGFDGGWWFRRRDGIGGRERAGDPDELHKLIVGDYEFRPVRRDDVR